MSTVDHRSASGRGFSARLDRALAVAAKAHAAQKRKGTDIPYIMHPFHVALILDRHGYPEDVVIAGVLHDLLEDTDHAEESLRAEFGDEVVRLVKSVSEVKTEGGTKRPWRVRKEEQLDHLRHATPHEAALKGADALHNVRSILNDLKTHGIETMKRFNAIPADQIWYFGGVAEIVRQRLGGENALALEFEDAVAELRGKLSESDEPRSAEQS